MVDKQRISSIKPKKVQKPKPEMIWNDKDIKAYTDLELQAPDNVCQFELDFLNKVDVRKAPIERTVTRMFRLWAPDYSTPKHERKQYIYYQEEWSGQDWRGIPVFMRNEHYEGVYTKRYLRPHLNEKTGEIDYNELDNTRAEVTYEIPWNKKNIDDIITKSARTTKENIVFTIKFVSDDSTAFGYGPRMASHNNFSYEQFAEWDWEDIYNFHVAPRGNYWDRKAKQYKSIGAQQPAKLSHIA